MPSAPQATRTFFTSSTTWERRAILQSQALCELLLAVLRENRAKQRFQLHEFVFMPDHVHFILTPVADVSLSRKRCNSSKAASRIAQRKRRTSTARSGRKVTTSTGNAHAQDYAKHVEYVWMNPVKVGLVERPAEYQYSSARLREEVDASPLQFRSKSNSRG